MIQTRVEKHVIKPNSEYYSILSDFCSKSKNLYNHANYLVRQEFTQNNNWIRYAELDSLLKADLEYPDYKQMPTAQIAQQILRLLDKNWKSFFVSIKDWKKNPNKYLGKPKLPKYLKKDGKYLLILTNQNCKIKNNTLHFPRVFNGFTLKTQVVNKINYKSFQQVRVIPKKSRFIIELVYNVEIPAIKLDNNRYIGIDLGVNNLIAVCNNAGNKAFIINGRPLKSYNQYYNKQISYYRKVTKQMNKTDYSSRMNKLTEKRNVKIEDYMHKASKYLIDYCIKHNISKIVIGKNDGWKQKSDLSRKTNQNYVQIPHAGLIQMIQYKAEEKGIEVILTEESYTSGTSFIDNELPVKEFYNKSRRIHRGLFVSNNGISINADLNGAYQILKKVFPIKWDRGCALHPVIVNIA